MVKPASPASGKKKPVARRIRPAPTARAMARLRAVQALYQLEMSGGTSDFVIGEFRLHRMGDERQEEGMPEPDQPLFGRIVRGVSAEREALDIRLSSVLGGDLSFDRFEALLKTILRAGAYELQDLDVPAEVTIKEYVNLADAFFAERETGLVNAILQRLVPAGAGSEARHDGETPAD
ncbi:MAG TPA: transcription antitermination factor NusB [Dongiaceae bacterium]|jgi:N utilization substance protein B